MTLVADPQKKLTTTLLLRPKLRLKRGWPRPKPWPGTNVPYNNNGLDPCPCRVAAKEKKGKNIPKNQVFAEIYHDVVASEKTV